MPQLTVSLNICASIVGPEAEAEAATTANHQLRVRPARKEEAKEERAQQAPTRRRIDQHRGRAQNGQLRITAILVGAMALPTFPLRTTSLRHPMNFLRLLKYRLGS